MHNGFRRSLKFARTLEIIQLQIIRLSFASASEISMSAYVLSLWDSTFFDHREQQTPPRHPETPNPNWSMISTWSGKGLYTKRSGFPKTLSGNSEIHPLYIIGFDFSAMLSDWWWSQMSIVTRHSSVPQESGWCKGGKRNSWIITNTVHELIDY